MKKAPFRCFSFIYNQNNHWLFILLPCRTFVQFIKHMFSQKQRHWLLLKDSLLAHELLNQLNQQFTNQVFHWIRLQLNCFRSLQLFRMCFLLRIVHWFCLFFLEQDQFFQSVLLLILFVLLLNCFKNWLHKWKRWLQKFKQWFVKSCWFFSLVFLPFWTTYEINCLIYTEILSKFNTWHLWINIYKIYSWHKLMKHTNFICLCFLQWMNSMIYYNNDVILNKMSEITIHESIVFI